MVFCTHCTREVPGIRPYEGALACNMCGRILENLNFSTEIQFFKNVNGQSQAAGSSLRERRIRIARDEFMNLRDGLGIGDERDDVIDMAVRFFEMAVEQNFTKGCRTELVQSSCLYMTCREKNIPFLLIDFSSHLRVSVYELGSVYLQLCEMLYITENRNYEKLVDPSIFIPRFLSTLLDRKCDKARTARDIIASMKRDWIQVNQLTEREREMHKISFTTRPSSNKESVLCMHQECKPFGYGLCERCYNDFISVSSGLVGGPDPPAFQPAEKERMEKTAREENEEAKNAPPPATAMEAVRRTLDRKGLSGFINYDVLEELFNTFSV